MNETSEFIADGFEGISTQFTDITEVMRTSHNVLLRARRYGRWWMLKGLLPEEAGQMVYQVMLRKEAELMISLDHPNIVHTYGLVRVEGVGVCIVMEWVDGQTLEQYLRTGHPSRRTLQRLMNQLMDAIAYMHMHGIVHRDLKPQNIMVTANGSNLHLIDFGLADKDSYAVLKQPAGTASYMAPEQASGGPADVRNDIYSIGVIMQQLSLGPATDSVVRRCLQPIDRRYHDVEELQEAFDRSVRLRRWYWGLAALLVVVLCGAGCLLWHLYNQPAKPVYITSVEQISYTKQYYIRSKDQLRGSLGVANRALANDWQFAQRARCDSASTFAFVRYEGALYLYSTADRRFINYGTFETDAPLYGYPSKIGVKEKDSLFVIDFIGGDSPLTLNLNEGNGVIITNWGTANEVYDDGNMLMLQEAGDFDPSESLGIIKTRTNEYEAALRAIEPDTRYTIYTLDDGRGHDGGTRHYLRSDGRLTDTMTDSCVFVLHRLDTCEMYRPSAMLICHHDDSTSTVAAGGHCHLGFTSLLGQYSDLPSKRGYLEVRPELPNSWVAQVLFLGANGCYAVRSTAVPHEIYTCGAYWTATDGDGHPEINYSADRPFIWHIEKQ